MSATLYALAVLKKRKGQDSPRVSTRLIIVLVISAAALTGAWAYCQAANQHQWGFTKFTISFVLLSTVSLCWVYLIRSIHTRLSRTDAQYYLFSVISFVVAFMLFLSWPAFEAMVIPGLPFLAAAVLHRSAGVRSYVLHGLGALMIFYQTVDKLQNPYSFAGWIDAPVRSATAESTLPRMRGLRLPPDTVHMIDDVTSIIKANSAPGDTIFTYPTMPAFHATSGRFWPTYSVDQNIDVVTDEMASQDAGRILRNKPAAIVYFERPPEWLEREEFLWRGGRPSGQRDLVAAIHELSKTYHLAATYPVSTLKGAVLKVYVRPSTNIVNVVSSASDRIGAETAAGQVRRTE